MYVSKCITCRYLKSIDSYDEQRDYLTDMLDMNDPKHLVFIQEFVSKRTNSAKISALAPPGMVAYKKKDDDSDLYAPKAKSKGKKGKDPTPERTDKTPPKSSDSSGKKGSKYVPLFAKDGKVDENVMILPGRNACHCQAQKHDLVNNCLQCGRVVCKQEGSGPCLFCGHLVCTKDEQEVLNRGSRKSEALMKKLMAETHKNTLLEYDRTTEKRTRVIDDESDYFSVDAEKWMTSDQRKKVKEREKELWEQKHGSRLNKKYTFDFSGKKVVEDKSDFSTYDPEKDEKLKKILEEKSKNFFTKGKISEESFVAHPGVNRPTYVQAEVKKMPIRSDFLTTTSNLDKKHIIRVQDAQLQQMRDDGWCLSMHQPWASYLVSHQ